MDYKNDLVLIVQVELFYI